jgi:hypothetical protein
MCAGSTDWASVIIPAAFGLMGTVIGAVVTYRTSEKRMRRKSVYDIADLFANEAAAWGNRSFNFLDADIKFHNDSIDRLSPHVHYLERNHRGIGLKIWPSWTAFHGGDAGKAITRSTYDQLTRNKDYWIEELYHIADTLRDC